MTRETVTVEAEASGSDAKDSGRGPRAPTTPAAQRALAEAAERRKATAAQARPAEVGGRGGLEPVRYGDWEVKGIATDF